MRLERPVNRRAGRSVRNSGDAWVSGVTRRPGSGAILGVERPWVSRLRAGSALGADKASGFLGGWDRFMGGAGR